MPIKSFKGQIIDNGIDTVVLHTNTGSTGYKIVKLEVFPVTPGAANVENVLQIFSVPQSGTTSATPDFNDNTLLGAAYFIDNGSSAVPTTQTISFDNQVFNQDIYITQRDIANATPGNGSALNYYIELEQIKLDLTENTVATLKDIRNIEAQ
tara:strand:- start:32 stop:487 length:456 start_codon:yes stop_codon:yes gene_type:complete